jgi:hypothetical protein
LVIIAAGISFVRGREDRNAQAKPQSQIGTTD